MNNNTVLLVPCPLITMNMDIVPLSQSLVHEMYIRS